MYDIILISDQYSDVHTLRKRFPLAKHAKTFNDAKQKSFTKMFWVVYNDIIIKDNFKFDYIVSEWDQNYIHVFKNGDNFDGICLVSTDVNVSEKELKYRFFTNKKEIDIIASVPKPYDIFTIDSYDDYQDALNNTTTEMFWALSKNVKIVDDFKFDLYFTHHNSYDRNQNHAFIHIEDEKKTFDGVFLLSKNVPLSKKEIEFRFPINRKEWNIVASVPKPYDIFTIDSYDDYQDALSTTTTEMFWVIPKEVEPLSDFDFNIYYSKKDSKYEFERKINHVFKNLFNGKETYNGIMLMSTHMPALKREIDFRFLVEKVEHSNVASKHRRYDVVFVSYNEPNADTNYEILKQKIPNVKRVHGVKGIHQAHIEAAKLVDTDMFWVVDGDAIIKDEFNFDLSISRYERDIVFTWRSENPVNGLIYGYGGVKLLPTKLTLEMDVSSPDMTTAISSKFKAVDVVSNITAFNTDPFNTWKSAFRECVKLASKTIRGQIDAETDERLNTWCTVVNGDFAIYALRGANAGRIYGQENAANPAALSKINDFDWLEQQFKLTSVLR